MNLKTQMIAFLTCTVLLLSLAACRADRTQGNPKGLEDAVIEKNDAAQFSKQKKIELSETKLQLEPGEIKKIKLNNVKATKVSWSTSDRKVAKVSKGRIKAVNAGTATITAKYKEKKYRCTVLVKSKVKEREIIPEQPGMDTAKQNSTETEQMKGANELVMLIGDKKVNVQWEDNDSVQELKELCSAKPLTISMSMYGGFEQVGSLGTSILKDDKQKTAKAGDIVLYSGNQLVVFYGSNSWAYTKLGHITDQDAAEMKELLGNGDVAITISLESI